MKTLTLQWCGYFSKFRPLELLFPCRGQLAEIGLHQYYWLWIVDQLSPTSFSHMLLSFLIFHLLAHFHYLFHFQTWIHILFLLISDPSLLHCSHFMISQKMRHHMLLFQGDIYWQILWDGSRLYSNVTSLESSSISPYCTWRTFFNLVLLNVLDASWSTLLLLYFVQCFIILVLYLYLLLNPNKVLIIKKQNTNYWNNK